jgi:PiT family inorganic phosphate transporter
VVDISTWFFISSGLFLGWSLGANHAVNVFGTAVVSKMVKFHTAAIIAGTFVVLGSVISGSGTTKTISELGPINAIAGSFSVALAVGISVTAMTRAKLPVSTSQAVIGAIVGWNIFTGSPTDLDSLSRIVLSWVASPVVAGVIGYLVFLLIKKTVLKWKIHLLELDNYTRIGLIVVGAAASYSLGANNIANVMGMFVFAPLFKDYTVAGVLTITGVQQLFFLGGIAIAFGIFTYGRNVMETVGSDLYKISPLTGFVVVLAEFIVLTLFTSVAIESFLLNNGLPSIPLVPLSTTQAFIGAILGVGLAKDPHSINFKVLGKIALGWAIAPVSAGIITFVSLFFIQNVFEQKVIYPVPHEISGSIISRLEEEAIPVENIQDLKGKRFDNKKVLRNELMKRYNYTNAQIYSIFQYALIDSFRIDSTKAGLLDTLRFSPGQISLLKENHGRTFMHKIDFDNLVFAHRGDWELTGNKLLDKEILEKKLLIEELMRVRSKPKR